MLHYPVFAEDLIGVSSRNAFMKITPTRDVVNTEGDGGRASRIWSPSDQLMVSRESQDALLLLEEGSSHWNSHIDVLVSKN